MILQFGDTTTNVIFWSLIATIIVLAIIGQIILCVWVYRNAQKRGMEPSIWLLIVLIASIIGLIIYIIVREPLLSEERNEP